MANVAILTTFQEFKPGYSLTGIVRDQVRMLTEYNNEVYVFVNEKFNFDKNPFENNPNCHVLPTIPFGHLIDYGDKQPLTPDHEAIANKTTDVLVEKINELGITTVFTHDFIFTGWNKPYAIGIQHIGAKVKKCVWLHWVHSIPSRYSDWWYLSNYGPGHRIVYPNKTDRLQVAEQYRTTIDNIVTIPHIKDLRVMYDFDDATCELIDHFPRLMRNDIVQIYPASSDRFDSKRVSEVIRMLAFIKSMGHSVCLFIANQWATTAKHYANIKEYYDLGKKYGLEPYSDLIFSSTVLDGKYKAGVPAKILTELMMLSNLFIFPTREETFGLVLPEVSLASGALCIVNSSLDMMPEICGLNTLALPFGSYNHAHEPTDQDAYLRELAMITMGRMQQCDSVMLRSHFRKHNNYDALFARYYAPIMAESRLYLV